MSTEPGYRLHKDGVIARITLDRAERHNAFDDALIAGLTAAFTQMGAEADVRAVILAAEGKSFSAGADLGWMKRMAGYSVAENQRDAMGLAGLMQAIDQCPKPVIGLIQGPAYGGGIGLVACCDIALGTPDAAFCLSEVKLGLIPATISPYVIRAMGARAARRYFLTAEVFDATEALRLNLLHAILPDQDALQAEGARLATLIARNGPAAIAAAKRLVEEMDRPLDDDLIALSARRIADIRASEEGREGIAAFLEKRRPGWAEGR